MKKYVIVIFIYFIFVSYADFQTIQYANKIRNYSITSETRSLHVYNITLLENSKDHRLVGCVNITKDFYVKDINALFLRCSFDKSPDCEIFQNWTITRSLKSIAYMKNQIWTPLFENVSPKLDLPFIRKQVYCTRGSYLETKGLVSQYPHFIDYIWRLYIILHDQNNKKPFIIWLEGYVVPYTEGNGKRERKQSTSKRPFL